MSEEPKKNNVENPFADSSEVERHESKWQRWKPLLREENHKGVRLLLRAIAIAFALFTTVVFSVIAKLLDTSKAVGFH
jgi:hypothetical protein